MNLEQPCIRISVRNLVEFILRHGDIDNRTGGADKEAMQQGSRIHRKIQRQQGAEYRAEVPLKYQIACDGFILSVEGRADGIIELPKRVVIDEIKGVFKDLKRLKEPQLLHLAQAKCYDYIYAEQKNLEEIGDSSRYIPGQNLRNGSKNLYQNMKNGQDTRWNGEQREMLQSKQWNSHSNIETDRRNWLRRYTGQF